MSKFQTAAVWSDKQTCIAVVSCHQTNKENQLMLPSSRVSSFILV